MKKHTDSFMSLEELGTKIPGYRPTFDFPGEFINRSHQFLSNCPVKDGILIQLKNRRWFGQVIEGWLTREDALKLYEIAYFVPGDILELGSYNGLSTCILSQANHDSSYRKTIYSVDLNPSCVDMTNRNLHRKGLAKYVRTICDDALSVAKRLAFEGKQFEFVFIDHSHAYEPVYNVCRQLGKIVSEGGFSLFHDFNNPRNRDPEDKDYGVYQAVMDGLSSSEFEFCGIYGASALYRSI